MQGHGGQAARIVGQGAFTFTANFNMPFKLFVKYVKVSNVFTGPFDQG